MSVAPISAETIATKMASLPSMSPRPTMRLITAWEQKAVDVVAAIPSQQSAALGYQGMIQHADIYALRSPDVWQHWPNPGPTRRGTTENPHPQYGTNLSAAQARDEDAIWKANRAIYENEQNVKQGLIDSLNRCVPRSYRRSPNQGIGHNTYTIMDDPRDIIQQLRTSYGTATPQEKRNNDNRINQQWMPNETFEDVICRLEDCYTFAIIAQPAYTTAQMVDKAKTAVQLTGLYQTAILEWNALDDVDKTWANFKNHFTVRRRTKTISRPRNHQHKWATMAPTTLLMMTTASAQYKTASPTCRQSCRQHTTKMRTRWRTRWRHFAKRLHKIAKSLHKCPY